MRGRGRRCRGGAQPGTRGAPSLLLKNGHTTEVKYDQALKTYKTAQAQADAACARNVQASDNLRYTQLTADHDGVITAVGADAGRWSAPARWSCAWPALASARRCSTSQKQASTNASILHVDKDHRQHQRDRAGDDEASRGSES